MELLSTEEASAYLRLNPKRVQALARSGKLPGRRIGRKWLFRRRDLDALLSGAATLETATGLDISARNQLRGQVLGLTLEGVMAEVRVGIGDQELTSVITRASAERLKLRVGDPVFALIKSTEVMIGKEATVG
jgi:molybdate transport system regulatory protein